MTIKECILQNFKRVFNNTGIPCNNLFISAIKEHIGINCEVVERTNESIIVRLLFTDAPMTIRCTFRNTESVTKFITNIELID